MAKNQSIGVISDSALQRHVIQNVLNQHGMDVALICDPGRLDDQPEERIEQVQCWILDLPDDDEEYRVIEEIFEADTLPVLYGLEPAPDKSDEDYPSWERRLVGKLEAFLDEISLDEPDTPEEENVEPVIVKEKQIREDLTEAESVWVLAASTGGPEAVKAFLDRIPARIKTGFLYAQHIDNHFSDILTKVLGRHGEIPLKTLEQNDKIYEGQALVVPVDTEIEFNKEGCNVKENEWPGPYGPSINQLLKNVLDCYGGKCNVIIFSGMGDDGTESAKLMKQEGCMVWSQAVESCANASMPQSVIDAGCCDFSAEPEMLAEKLVKMVGMRYTQ